MTAPITQDVLTLPRKLPLADKINIVGLTRAALRDALIAAGTPEKQAKMRVGQVWQWVYHWGVRDFALMTNLSKDYRALLAGNFTIEIPEVVTRQISEDGTRKYLVRIAGGHEVEVVYIPETDRGTLCISSQVGCTLTCSFCHTGTQKLVRNLTAGEIVGQVMLARDDLDEWPVPGAPKEEVRLVSNIVLMGMGEPLYNFENVRDAMNIVMDGEGIALGRRRITLSTSGVVPEIARTATEIGCLLAVSFHATTDEVRDQLVPINRRWNIAYTNLFIFSVFYVIGAMAVGLLLAILIDQRIRAESFWRTIFLYPLAVSFIVTGTVWSWLYSPTAGIEFLVRTLGWSDFDKLFKIQSQNAELVKSLLQNGLATHLIDISKDLKQRKISSGGIGIAFSGTDVWIAVPTKAPYGLFNPSLHRPVNTPAFLEQQTAILNAAVQITSIF